MGEQSLESSTPRQRGTDDLTPTTVRPSDLSPAAPRAPSSRLRAFGVTHPGRIREENQDAFVVAPELGLAVVADGVAGAGGGTLAAEVAVLSVHQYFQQESTRRELAKAHPEALDGVARVLLGAATAAHDRVRQAAASTAHLRMGTTLAMLLLVADHAFVMHVGDSRVHRLRGGRIELLTDDHTALNQWIEQNGPPSDSIIASLGHILVRAVSAGHPTVRPDLWVEPVQAGDLFLLSTDGLTRVVSEDRIRELALGAPTLEAAARDLLDAALAAGGPDNITAALLRCGSERRSPGAGG